MRQPLALFTWALAVSVLVLFATLTAPVGPVIFIALMPIVTLMTLSACKHVAADRTMLPSMWVKPLQKPGVARKMVSLGVLYASLCLTAGLLSFLPFSSDLAEGMRAASVTNDVTPLLEALRGPLLIFGTLYVVIAALFWHAPVLIAWHGVRLGQALFFSGIACWRNKWAFVVYGLSWAAIFLGIDFCASMLVAIGLPTPVVSTLQIPVNIAAGGILYSSFYPAYTSVFESNESAFEFHDGDRPQA